MIQLDLFEADILQLILWELAEAKKESTDKMKAAFYKIKTMETRVKRVQETIKAIATEKIER